MPDTDTFRLRVMRHLKDGIKAALPDVASVDFGISTYGETDALPLVSLIEDPREQPATETSVPGKGHLVPWRLLVQGFVEDASAEPTAPAYNLGGQIMQTVSELAVAGEGVLSPERKVNRVEQIKIGAPIVRPPDEFSSKAYCWIPITLELFETPSQPFT